MKDTYLYCNGQNEQPCTVRISPLGHYFLGDVFILLRTPRDVMKYKKRGTLGTLGLSTITWLRIYIYIELTFYIY